MAARAHRSRTSNQTCTPEIHRALPFQAGLNPAVHDVAEANFAWARRTGLLQKAGDTARLWACAPEMAAARMFPTAALSDLTLAAAFLTWLFFLDDQIDSPGRDNHAPLIAVAQALELPRTPPSDEPLANTFADLYQWIKALGGSQLWRQRFVDHLKQVVRAFGSEARQRARSAPPSEDAYVHQRRTTSCAWVFADLTELLMHAELPGELWRSRHYQELIECSADIAAWDNDVLSLNREITLAEVNNLVLVLATARNVSIDEARRLVIQRLHRRIGDYLPAEHACLSLAEATGAPCEVVWAFRHTLGGIVTWNHTDTRRFVSSWEDAS
ncbi:terpene synthase family protein [Streptomyces spectabilis]|uniref:Terpene synthase n=1 Tax=Streptomyces spectabilis TaxID=68270 RepID=A0A7W8B6Z3_STRST|nr:terpene synthase family protein [Streptomyces spectabilis]MBB5109718.1 hypothetical protein [Streptomyces spectabilis]GGV55341.1 hypothetical protein GCM10010245_87670 [Streptomyces spectabilis]